VNEPWKTFHIPPNGRVSVEYPEHEDERKHRLEQDAKDREHRRAEEAKAERFRRTMLVTGVVVAAASAWVAAYGPADTRSFAVNVCVGIVSAVAGSAFSK
jgi:preprotein translocase subunit SecF